MPIDLDLEGWGRVDIFFGNDENEVLFSMVDVVYKHNIREP